MSLPHYFCENTIEDELKDHAVLELMLSENDKHHMRVARLCVGEHISVVDETGNYFECALVNVEGPIQVTVTQKVSVQENLLRLTLVQGITKSDKFDLVVQHATEIGVDQFIPYKAARSVAKIDEGKVEAKVSRWNSIAKAASMQSGRQCVPVVTNPATIKQLPALLEQSHVLLCWEETESTLTLYQACEDIKRLVVSSDAPLSAAPACPVSIAVVVGPEGGLTSEEVESFSRMGVSFHQVSLGSSILRTETAGIVAPALVEYSWGNLGGQRD